MKTLRKACIILLTVLLAVSAAAISASACSSIYVGAALTENGTAFVARSEDLTGSVDKLFFYRETGTHKAGEAYHGCSGFTWAFSHDSCAYTAFPDDNGDGVGGVCPNCGSTEKTHVSYEEAGTNEKGLTVTATESLLGNFAVSAIDPLVGDGIAETDIATILLCECSTAREAVGLLLGIYDERGAQEANGLFIADQKEIWYIENLSGHQYIALLLPDDLVFIEPNLSVIGPIDLDDTDHVIASAGLIGTAVEAGTFAGDAGKNVIDFRASYSDAVDFPGYGARMISGLNYLCGEEIYAEENTSDSDFVISNVDENGAVVELYTNLRLTHPYTVDDVVRYFRVDPIGKAANQETHIFEIDPGKDPAMGTIEWVSMANGRYTVFVPHYPMLIRDTYEGYRTSTAAAEFASEEPTDGRSCYPDSEIVFRWNGSFEMDRQEGFRVLPENWRSSYYWCFDAVAEQITSGAASAGDEAYVVSGYASLQREIYDRFAAQQTALDGMTPEEASAFATEDSAAMARDAQAFALSLYDELMSVLPGSETVSGEAS